MNRPDYLEKYQFDWETFDVMLGGKSALDAKKYLGHVSDRPSVEKFLKGYGFDPKDKVLKAELFGNYQEALQFIKRYFLKEGNPEGLDLKIPNTLYMITDVDDLFLLASGALKNKYSVEDSMWAGVVLKIMHTILHADRDLRSHYFPQIQTQIFDRFYRFIHRDNNNNLFLKSDTAMIPLVDFQTKSKKSRESIVIKLLHKVENVAEELFDKVGIRIITHNRLDCIQVLKFLHTNYVVLAHNIKPSRSVNSLVNFKTFRQRHFELLKDAIKEKMPEEVFVKKLEQIMIDSAPLENPAARANPHTAQNYRSMQFTCRQLIQYKNPFIMEFNQLKKMAKELSDQNDLTKRIMQMDTSSISRDVMFFYPFEVQVNDIETYRQNTEGDASHQEYKKAQVQTAMKRVFRTLIEYKKIELP